VGMMEKIRGKIQIDGQDVYVGQQCFETNTVEIEVDGKKMHCPLFQDKDGDIGFIFKGDIFYFREVDVF
jgi:hypothetical protein